MRFRLLLLCLPVLLGACSKTSTPVQLDLIGATGLTSGSRTVNPGDTLTSRLYAVGNDDSLRRLRIVVTYSPGLKPIAYPTPLSSFNPDNAPDAQEIVYLDSLIRPIYVGNSPRGGEYLFNNSFSTRTTSGTELWQYTVTDNKQESASRAYRLTVRQPDSSLVYHRYTAVLRPVPGTRTGADDLRARNRVFLNLRTGLLLPKFAVLNREASVQANQTLVDLVALSANGTSVSLSSPDDTRELNLNAARWPDRRSTVLRSTRLNETDFANTATTAALDTAFARGTDFALKTNTGPLAKNQVIAFQVKDANDTYTGLLLVRDLLLGTSPTLACTVKVEKAP
ncbi:hypothetical protein [Hymenobacter ruricola]|uniref:DUF4249 family protein n=1 Tax=Hymenobacter ruricola TaxID=2791023 RepID=A0ABS0I8F8_9BACT|nr:hypothetical protein [Hymenobacter ruricola]MBF9222857.1 hypothetical protein [Hymenobacter ruricola]